ncbi:tyrosine-protein phosphatase [Corynebacterium glyciniphilum]|uniref:tyrosine-protein phosphatase n=1 Tax=Corynebacterium glyciniphilum TaxID=1404244 RepID=UPI00164235BF|nr:tyrosine-protein phosphatase [Corynebacterium glyciniphilum]
MNTRPARLLPYRPALRPVLAPATAALVATSLLLVGCQAQAAESVPGSVTATDDVQTVALETPRLASADNFRDLAGTDHAYSTGDGHLKAASVYRSNALDITDEDLATVEGLGISTVIDLRTDSEIEEHPDRVPEGAEYVHVDVVGGATTAANPTTDLRVDSPDAAATMLGELNRSLVTDDGMKARLAKAVTAVAEADGPVVFHCTAGKDRAGWVSAVLQLAAGVTEKDVIANYLATNDYSKDRIDATVEQIRESEGDQAADTYRVLLGVQEGFLRSGLDALKEFYGDVDTYLVSGLGLDVSTVLALKEKLVEK